MLPSAASTAESDGTTIELSSHSLVFPDGLVGCQAWKNFVLLTDDKEDLPVAYLQSLDEPHIRLLVTNPLLVENSYAAKLTEDDRASIELEPTDQSVLYCTLTVDAQGNITANLLGPLVVNPRTRRGRQLVLTESSYSTRHPVAQLQEA